MTVTLQTHQLVGVGCDQCPFGRWSPCWGQRDLSSSWTSKGRIISWKRTPPSHLLPLNVLRDPYISKDVSTDGSSHWGLFLEVLPSCSSPEKTQSPLVSKAFSLIFLWLSHCVCRLPCPRSMETAWSKHRGLSRQLRCHPQRWQRPLLCFRALCSILQPSLKQFSFYSLY